MSRREWWQVPKLRTDEEQDLERKVGWLELFFDLYFVVAIAELSHSLAKHVSWAGLGEFIFLFIPVWWIWIGATYYIERFETEGIEHRLFIFLQMIPIAGLAIFAHHGLGETSIHYGLSYALSRIIQVFLWWRAGYHDRQFRPTANRFVFGFSLSILLFCLSIFVSPPHRFILWGIGFLVDLATPLSTFKQQSRLPRLSSSKLPERYGLFIIIVLGESVVGVVQGMAERETLSLIGAITGILGIALAFGLWWVYFDFIARRPPKPSAQWAIPWSYLHMPLAISITAAGAASLNIIAEQNYLISVNVSWLMAGSVSIALLSMALLEKCLKRLTHEPTHPQLSPLLKLSGGIAAICCGILGSSLGAIPLQILLVSIIGIQAIYGVYVWFSQDIQPEGSVQPSMD